jgi:hypothetical protein
VRYINHGYAVIPIPAGRKAPNLSNWQHLRMRPEDAPTYFDNGQNIGILLGEPSNGLVDVDLDTPEAVAAGRYLLPATLCSGRESSPNSHYWYRCDPVPSTAKFQVPRGTGEGSEMFVELRSTGKQTVVAPSVHPDGDKYAWGEGETATISGPELLERAREVATAALLARHWPSRGRHELALAAAGYLGRRLDPERVEAVIQAAAGAAGDEERRDRSRAVRDTLEGLGAGRSVTGGPTLEQLAPGVPDIVARWWGWSREPGEKFKSISKGPGPVEAATREKDRFERIDLGEPIASGMEPPDMLVPEELYAGRVHCIYAAGGTGKTFKALSLIKKVIDQGKPVLLLDLENGVRIISDRLRDLGVEAEQVRQNLYYYPFPSMPLSDEASAEFEELLEEVKPVLIVVDSWINCLSAAGLDENSATDIAQWAEAYPQRARVRGIASLLLDHVPKEGGSARGSGRKLDYVDVMWELRNPQKFDRETVGRIDMHLRKDREGWLPKVLTFSVGAGENGFVFKRSAGTVEPIDEEGLSTSERSTLDALRAFGSVGAADKEWREEAIARGLSRATYYRCRETLMRLNLVERVMNKFFDKTPAKPKSHEVSNESHETNETTANMGSLMRSHPPKGETNETTHAGTPSEEQRRRIAKLVRQGMAEHLARAEVFGQ